MKKIYIVFAALLIGGATFLEAQTQPTTRWYNYSDTKSLNSQINEGNASPSPRLGYRIFPDTTIQEQFTNPNNNTTTFVNPQFHGLANVLDVASIFFNDGKLHAEELSMATGSKFTVDSMSVLLRYNRMDMTVTDTLYVEIVVDALPTATITSSTSAPAIDAFGVSSIQYKRVYFDGDTVSDSSKRNTMYNAKKLIYKVLLNDEVFADSTANGTHLVKFATPGLPEATAGTHQVASAIKFIPGYTWTGADILNLKNNILMMSTEENGSNTFMSYKTGDFNLSYFMQAKELYYLGPDFCMSCSGKRYYDPSFSYTFIQNTTDAGWPLENHDWAYKVTCVSGCSKVAPDGVTEEANFTNGIKLGQNTPNPANGMSVINYELTANSTVSLSVYDITGKKVMTIEEGKKAAGKYALVLNANQLQSGIYFYTLNTDAGTSLTRKMVITE